MGDPPDDDAEVAVAMNSVTFDRSITPTRGRGSPRHNAARDRCLSRTSEDLRELEEISQTLHDIVDEGDATAKSWSARKRGVAEAEERVFAALRQTRQAHDERRRAVSEAEESARRVAETTTEQLAAARDAMDAIHEMEIVDERALGETRAALATSEAARDAALRRVADLEAALATADDAQIAPPSKRASMVALTTHSTAGVQGRVPVLKSRWRRLHKAEKSKNLGEIKFLLNFKLKKRKIFYLAGAPKHAYIWVSQSWYSRSIKAG